MKRKQLTPDERENRERERAEKRQKLEDEKRRKNQERLEKELEKAEKERLKEQERLKREEEKRKREVAKEQERIKKEEDLAKKAEEKRKRDEEKQKKEEERKKALNEKEKEKLKQEEIAAKQARTFTSYFQKCPPIPKVKTFAPGQSMTTGGNSSENVGLESDKENNNNTSKAGCSKEKVFKTEVLEIIDASADVQILAIKKPEVAKFSPMPFQIRSNMELAPLLRRKPLTDEDRDYLDKILKSKCIEDDEPMEFIGEACTGQTVNKWRLNFIERVKKKEMRRSGKTMLVKDADVDAGGDDVPVIIEEAIPPPEGYKKYRMKLLQFHLNRRPAYWGTWKKKPKVVGAVHPWAKEEDIEYDFDSDDEWEDEPEDGEEIENSEGEEETEDLTEGEPQDEEDEEGWMVPHGYLSDNEREGEDMDLEMIKCKEKEFFRSLKEKVKLGIPVIQTKELSKFKMIFPPSVLSRQVM